MDRSETCTTYSICNVVVHYAFSNCYLFWGSKGVIREINTLKSASTSASKQTCTMFTMCKVVFFLSNIIYQYYWGTLVIQITLLKGHVLQSTSPLQYRNGLLCNHNSFKRVQVVVNSIISYGDISIPSFHMEISQFHHFIWRYLITLEDIIMHFCQVYWNVKLFTKRKDRDTTWA
jgi:hypothetical protein